MLRSPFSSSSRSSAGRVSTVRKATLSVLAGALVLAGCATDDSAPIAEADLTAEQRAIAPYVIQAEKICARERAIMAKTLSDFETHESVSGSGRRKTVKVAKPEDVAKYAKAYMGRLETQQTDLRKIKLPDGAPGVQIDGLWTKAETIILTVKKDPQKAAYDDPFYAVAKELRTLGFSQCFQPQRPQAETEGK